MSPSVEPSETEIMMSQRAGEDRVSFMNLSPTVEARDILWIQQTLLRWFRYRYRVRYYRIPLYLELLQQVRSVYTDVDQTMWSQGILENGT